MDAATCVPSSLRSLLCLPTWSPTTPEGASQTYCTLEFSATRGTASTSRVLPFFVVFLVFEGASSAAGSAGAPRVVLVGSGIRNFSSGTRFLRFRGLPSFSGLTGFSVAKVTSHESSTLSSVLVEPACHFMFSFLGNFVSMLIQVRWGDTDPCWNILIYMSPLLIFYFFQGRSPPRVEFAFPVFKQKRHCTQSLSGLLR